MGFGSYDESEQDQQEIDTSKIDSQDNVRTDFGGELAFESGANNDALLAQLREIKADKDRQE